MYTYIHVFVYRFHDVLLNCPCESCREHVLEVCMCAHVYNCNMYVCTYMCVYTYSSVCAFGVSIHTKALVNTYIHTYTHT